MQLTFEFCDGWRIHFGDVARWVGIAHYQLIAILQLYPKNFKDFRCIYSSNRGCYLSHVHIELAIIYLFISDQDKLLLIELA
ncbi:hypothetical protein CUN59_16095 [Cuspidothrix issatschenkoi CHARLIE-1]|uniref:Uncharacterized protein n=1 Tax=Cuspidothrix issatschenkoi CHARLIE-1 TaxID=2052836 RepID=A0A2S6CRL9_9CYAN|nr:hypothetical protein CUN59_16095 [Cuspidothrix issatschenkoi CHARLIE-1]